MTGPSGLNGAPGGSPSGALPTFVVIGATKCGTTSLHDWLSRHPQVYMHPWKEMRFFVDRDPAGGHWHRGAAWYAERFEDRGGAAAWGEASNGYTRGAEYPYAPERIALTIPEARLIYMVRDPMRRLVSHYRHRLATGREWRGPAEAMAQDPAYVTTGLYGAELARWHAHVDPGRILVVPFEAMVSDPGPWLDRICGHIGVDPAPGLAFGARNAASDRTALPAGLRRLGAIPALRGPLKRLSHRLGPRRGAAPLSRTPVDLPADLTDRIARRFAEDRPELERRAGTHVTEGWT